jgi:hypothetical protein
MTATLPPVTIQLVAAGAENIDSVLKGLEARLAAFEKRMARAFKEPATRKSRTGTNDPEVKAAEDSAKYIAKLKDKAASDAGKAAMRAAKEEAKAHQLAAKEAEKTAKYISKLKERAATDAGKAAMRAAKEEEKAAKKAADARKRFYDNAGKNAGKVVSGAAGTAGKVAGLVGTVGAIGGGFTVADALSGEMRAQKAAANFSVASAGGGPAGKLSTEEILKHANAVSKHTGVEAEDIIKGGQAFTAKTGNAQQGLALMSHVAKMAIAEGVNAEEYATALGTMSAQDATLTTEDLIQRGQIIAGQGKKGSIEVKDIASHAAKVTAKSTLFEGSKRENDQKMLGLIQAAGTTSGDAAEAATAVANLPSDVLKHEKEFKAAGISIRGKDGKSLKDINAIVAESIAKTGGDPGKLRQMFGERSIGVPLAAMGAYKEAEEKKKGTGQQAVIDYFKGFQEAALSAKNVEEDFNTVADTTQHKLNQAFNELKVTAGEKLLPELVKLIPKLQEFLPYAGKLIDAFTKLVGWVEENPLKSAFIGLAAIVTKSAGEAFAGDAIAGVMKAAFKNPAISIGAISALAIGAVAYAELQKVEQFAEKKREEGKKEATRVEEGITDLEGKIATASTPEEKKSLENRKKMLEKAKADQLSDAQAHVKELNENSFSAHGGTFDKILLGITNTVDDAAKMVGVDTSTGTIADARNTYGSAVASAEKDKAYVAAQTEFADKANQAADKQLEAAKSLERAVAKIPAAPNRNGDPIP